jgi:hypothetical protein
MLCVCCSAGVGFCTENLEIGGVLVVVLHLYLALC